MPRAQADLGVVQKWKGVLLTNRWRSEGAGCDPARGAINNQQKFSLSAVRPACGWSYRSRANEQGIIGNQDLSRARM
jgi:hypothetical protein